MKNLTKLKGKENYQRISVTEDYTLAERQIIKTWALKAKERNQNEPCDSTYIWHVRGSPKSGSMHLKKFKINLSNSQQQQ